jgi:CRISPR-associated protein Csb1
MQAIFAIDDATAESIRATFVLDVGLIRSFGRKKKAGKEKEEQLGLSEKQQEFLVALALWKIQKLLKSPFRFRSGCHLRKTTLQDDKKEKIDIDVNIMEAITAAKFTNPPITDVFWPREDLYREGPGADSSDQQDPDENEPNGPEADE